MIDDLWPMVSFLSISVRITTLIELRIGDKITKGSSVIRLWNVL